MSNDLAKLAGAWTLSTLEMDGNPMPTGGGIEIAGDRFRTVGMGHDYAGRIDIDPAAKPKRLDLVFTEGPEAGNRNPGIYELKGDTFRLCVNLSGKSRPRSFGAKAGSGNAIEVFTRGAAAAAAEPAEDVVTAAAGEGELVGEWEMVNAWQGGQALDARMVKTGRRVTTATHTTTYFGKQVFLNAAYTADPSRRPKTIDLTSKGKTQLGIYEVDGDLLRICFTAPGGPRPADFETKAGDGRTSAVWRRMLP